MKARVLVFLLFLVIASCKDDDGPTACNVADPINDLQWLKDRVAEIENSEFSRKYFYLVQADYNGQTVFYVNNCCPMCMTIIIYYDCAGNVLESVDASQVKNGRRIWMSDELECVFYD